MRNRRRHPNVTSFRDRHGKLRWRFRKTGQPTHYFTHPPDTPGFAEELAACVAGAPITVGSGRCIPRSVNDLVARYYQSADFNGGGPGDQRRRRLLIESFRAEFGDDLVVNFGFEHIEAILLARSQKVLKDGRIVGGQFAAHVLRKQLRRLFSYAKRLSWITSNPVDDAQKLRIPKTAGFHTWAESEIRQYQDRHPLGTRARLALEIMLWTAQRRSDARLLGPEHVRDGRVHYRQGKTGKVVTLPLQQPLREAIEAMHRVGLKTYLVTEFGKPYSVAGFGNKMREWCDEAGLPHCTAHGLRKAAARRLAESGATQQELKAIGGWSGDTEVATYTAAANQATLADTGLGRLRNANLANHVNQLAKSKPEGSEND